VSRNNKSRRKEKQQKQRRKASAARRSRPPRWTDVCDQAAQLMDSGLMEEAREVLEEYDAAHPGQREVMRLLLDVYHEQGDYGPYCQVCRRLMEKEPDNHILQLMLAGGYLNHARPASALQGFRRFIELHPNDPLVEGARETMLQIEPEVEELLRDVPFSGDDRLEFAALHEEMLDCLTAGDCRQTIRLGEQLLARSGEFVPVMNNLSEAYFRSGRVDDAIAISRRALREQPDNFHALANLARHLFLLGRLDEAEGLREQLRSARSERDDLWCKKAEALSFFGDDQGVLAAFEDARRAGVTKWPAPIVSLLYHLAGVACARQGQHRRAHHYWRTALKIQPDLDLASDNLADAAREIGERHGPWSFSFAYWIRKETVEHLVVLLDRPAHRRNDEGAARAARLFAESHPEVVRLVPALLDRGDPAGRGFAWRFAMLLGTPEMFDALREFCLSQRGPDAMRIETANYLCSAGALPAGTVRIWVDGRWRESELIGYQVTSEPSDSGHCPQVDDWAEEGIHALRRGDDLKAEGLFQKCIRLEGDKPDLLNNLAVAYAAQGRTDESLRLARQIHERWPDYFFGRIAMANIATGDGDYEQADKLLDPLRRQRRLHVTEFAALAAANIHLLLARGKVDAARGWLDMWKHVDADHPDLERWEAQFRSHGLLGALRNTFRRKLR